MLKKTLSAIALAAAALGAQAADVLKVAATAVPHAEILNFVKPQLKAQGLDLALSGVSRGEMSRILGVNRSTVHRWLQDPEFLAELERLLGDPEGFGVITPGESLMVRVLGAVQAQDRAEHAKLDPASV